MFLACFSLLGSSFWFCKGAESAFEKQVGKIHLPSGFVVLENQRIIFLFMSHCGSQVWLSWGLLRCQGRVDKAGWKVG